MSTASPLRCDRVQHDALMARVARRVHDKRVLKLIRRYLDAGVMADGLVHASARGGDLRALRSRRCSATSCSTTSTGSWRSAGIGSCATPTTDVSTSKASARASASWRITQYIEQRLQLRLTDKSRRSPRRSSGPYWASVLPLPGRQDRRNGRSEGSQTSPGPDPEADHAQLGWTAYFAFADTILPFEKLEKWLRRRLRQVRWKEWKRPQTRYRNLRALGIPDGDARSWAASQKGYLRVAGSWPLQTALPNAYWHKTMGLKGFTVPYRRFREC